MIGARTCPQRSDGKQLYVAATDQAARKQQGTGEKNGKAAADGSHASHQRAARCCCEMERPEDAQSHDHSIRNDQPTKILEGGDRHQRDEPGERKKIVPKWHQGPDKRLPLQRHSYLCPD